MYDKTLKFINLLKTYADRMPATVTINDAVSVCETFLSYYTQTTFNPEETKMLYNAMRDFCRDLRSSNKLTFAQCNEAMGKIAILFEPINYTSTRGDVFLQGMHYIYDNREKEEFVNDAFEDLSSQVLLSTVYEYLAVVEFLKSPRFKGALMIQIYNTINGLSLGTTVDIGNTKYNNSSDFLHYCKIAELLGYYDPKDEVDRKRFLTECAAVSGMAKSNGYSNEMQFSEEELALIGTATNLFGV